MSDLGVVDLYGETVALLALTSQVDLVCGETARVVYVYDIGLQARHVVRLIGELEYLDAGHTAAWHELVKLGAELPDMILHEPDSVTPALLAEVHCDAIALRLGLWAHMINENNTNSEGS